MNISQIRLSFDRRAKFYDNPWSGYVGGRELVQIRRLVPGGTTVLDYGCGTGRTTLDLLQRGCKVTAYDISANMLAIARQKASQGGLEAEFVTDPSLLTARTWDWLTCIGVFDYYPDPEPLFKVLEKYLSPKGSLVITVPNALSPLAWVYALGSRLTTPCIPRSPAFIRQGAASSGFQVRQIFYAFPALAPLGHTLVLSLSRQQAKD